MYRKTRIEVNLDNIKEKDNIWNVNTEKEYHEEKGEWYGKIFWQI